MNRTAYLQWLCNKYGDFKVAHKSKDGQWSKHFSVLYCWHNLDVQQWRLEIANNRQIFACELVIDLDPNTNETIEDMQNKLKEIVKDLRKRQVKYKIFFSGSRGYHIHCIIPYLLFMPQNKRTKYRESILRKYNADVAKKSEKTMIALEYAPHWKTGMEKIEVMENGGQFRPV